MFFILLAALIVFCFDNRSLVNIKLGLNFITNEENLIAEVPLFFVILLSVAVGFFFGSFAEFFRSYKIRANNKDMVKDLNSVKGELENLKSQRENKKEELLSLLKQ